MRFERINDKNHIMYEKAIQLYNSSFPFHEQRENLSRQKILKDNAYNFDLIYDKDLFVGIVLFWETQDFIYIEHFCVCSEHRNKDYGKKILNLLCQRGKTIILEIDPPCDEISIRRKKFYERSGFVENYYKHVHPAYHKAYKGHNLVIMSYPTKINEKQYDCFNEYLSNHIMLDVF